MTVRSSNSPEAYGEISRTLIRQARDELEKGDLLQASEKTWGAAAHAIKSVAETRGWMHYAHPLITAAAWRLSREHNRPRMLDFIITANEMHQNFHEDRYGEDEVARGVEQTEEFLGILEEVKTELPRPFVPVQQRDRQRIGMLDGVLDLRGRPRRQ